VKEERSKIARPEAIHFLGLRLRKASEGGVEVHISARTEERLGARIRGLTPQNWSQLLATCVAEVNRCMPGWIAQFWICAEVRLPISPPF